MALSVTRDVRFRRLLRAALPVVSFCLVLGAIAFLNPHAISYLGFSLMLNLAIPIVLVTVAQMFVICGNDLDLSIGPFVSFVSCISATLLNDVPLLGAAVLFAGIAVYAGMGALIYLRRLPSIIVTLGMSFVWQGLAILALPQPGGTAPDWLAEAMAIKVPFVPMPILAALGIAAIAYLILMAPSYGAILRGTGGNPAAVRQAGWSLLNAKLILFALAGLFGVLSGMALIGITTSADANIGSGYTLLSIAGVILGGGEFVGGRVSPVGAVLGSLTLTLAASPLLTFLQIPPDWQIGANGAILIAVLAARALIGRKRDSTGDCMHNVFSRTWTWSFIGALVLWVAAMIMTHGQGAGAMLTSAFSLAVFMVIVGIGQMFVISLGPGNIDLSIPANIGLASAVAMTVMNGENSLVGLGLIAALACGLAAGAGNYLLIRALKIPPIIATLSTSFILQSIDISYGRGLQIKPPPGFADFTNLQVAGVPLLTLLAINFTCGAGVILYRTIYGRSVLAVGQNARAAWLAGIAVERTRALTYCLSGVLGGLNGALLAGYFRGSSVDIGNEYLLASIAVVVLGGTSVAGGKAQVAGLWGAALFLILLLTVLNTLGVSAGLRMVLTGAAIVAVITLAGGARSPA